MFALLLDEGGSGVPATFEPGREHATVEWHANHIAMLDPVIEHAFHQTVSAKRCLDMTLKQIKETEK